MLCHLSVRQFAVVKSLDIDFVAGMTAITGETGAGKSIAIDALGLCLGARADSAMVRPGADKAEITATFSVETNRAAMAWLSEHELDSDTDCIVRRTVSAEGRSKAYINGTPVPVAQLKGIGALLLCIHGQHAHHQLLKPTYQRDTLDAFADNLKLRSAVKIAFKQWQQLHQQYLQLKDTQQQREARRQLLAYQVSELDEFGMTEFEFTELEAEFKRLSNSQALLEESQRCVYELYTGDEGNALSLIEASIERLCKLQESDPQLTPISQMLNEASIQVSEAATELRDYYERLEFDPMRIRQVEDRYAQAMELSRKHQVQPEQLYEHHQQLATEFAQLEKDQHSLDEMDQRLAMAESDYQQAALQLSNSRKKAAKSLGKEIELRIRRMNMDKAKVAINVEADATSSPSASGIDSVDFTVSTNPGLPLDSLDKVLSGGELSRIGLAIQVINAKHLAAPTLIFDEVDTGISGSTASMVGQLLREIGAHGQVMCVTHLPQVAAAAHQQMYVTKLSSKQTTETQIKSLNNEERIRELARLLAGDSLTESALANARELLGQSLAA